jgi:hypothetical protein
LLSQENEDLFLKIQEDEKEYLKDEYNWNDSDIEEIWNNYYSYFRDRGIVGGIYKDKRSLGQEMLESYGTNNDKLIFSYFDFDRFAEDLLYEDRFIELSSGEIVELNY